MRPSGTWITPLLHDVLDGQGLRNFLSLEDDFTHARTKQAGDRLQGGALAGAVGADQGDDLAFIHVES